MSLMGELQNLFKDWRKCLIVGVLARSTCWASLKVDWEEIVLVCKHIYKKTTLEEDL